MTPGEVRAARNFLEGKGLGDAMPARLFAAASRELGRNFSETLKVVAELMAEGQGQGPAPEASKLAE